MTAAKPAAKKQKPPHPGELLHRVQSFVAEGKVEYSLHVLEDSMPDRGLDFDDVETILTKGVIRDKDKIKPGRKSGEWKCLVEDKLEGNSRWTGVAVVVRENGLLIATIEWVDP